MIINLVLNIQLEESRIFLILKLTFSIWYYKSVYKVTILSCEILIKVDILKLYEISLNKWISNSLLIYISSCFERNMGFLGLRLGLGLGLGSFVFIIFQNLHKKRIITSIYEFWD